MKQGLLRPTLVAAIGVVALLAIVLVTAQSGAADGLVLNRASAQVSPAGPDAAPDLTAEIALIPASPAISQTATIRITVRNKGTASTGVGFKVYLYVDPSVRPPIGDTSSSFWWQLPALAAGGSSILERNVTFTTSGCDHVIYVWVDKERVVANDSDPTNNLVSLPVCVGVTCSPDAYEPDNACAAARWSSSGAVQDRTLCPVGDEDWVKFTAVAGLTYTVAATDLGMHAKPLLSLYKTCGGLSQFGTGPQFEWFAPASGVYYIHVRHHDDTWGPLAGYKLRITAGPGSGDIYEPDDTCATARDIPTDGTRQTHLFQGPGDQDWVKFSVNVGDNFTVVADNTAMGVNPLISVYASCDQTAAALVGSGGVSASANAGIPAAGAPLQATQTYYAKVVNGNTNVYGPDAHYDLRVQAIACAGDAFEDDDTSGTAREIVVGAAAQTHNICQAGDEDWVKFTADAGATYVLHTSNLGIAADTYLYLYGTDGATELAKNDDYGYLLSSRIIWKATQGGTYYAKVRHHNPQASGADTRYDLAINKGSGCTADAFEPDNGALDAQAIATDGAPQVHTFCAGADLAGVGDQDWVRFDALGGADYLIKTANLGPQSDTILEVYDRNKVTLLASNDDAGPGNASALTFVAPATATYYVRVRHFNAGQIGDGTEYQLSVLGAPPPTPTPSPTPSPTATPSPTPTPAPHAHKTLILVNTPRMAALYGQAAADALLAKLYTLADHARVQAAVIEVANDAAVAAAYAAWTASPAALLDTANANAVAGAVRNLALTFLNSGPNVEYVVLVGGDQVIPHRRVPEGTVSVAEQTYAARATANTTLWAAVNANMTMTDDYYVDREPTIWQGRELYIPDYAIGRLVETPTEIAAQIDLFLANPVLNGNRALVTGYDFVFDVAAGIAQLLSYDAFSVDQTLIGQAGWTGAAQRTKMINTTPRFDIQSINTHADHQSFGAPNNDKVTASQIITGTSDLARVIVFSVGCHAGFNDSGSLDLAQAYAQRGAIYVGNTGYGWGGSGVVYTEKLMKSFAYNLITDTTARAGKALAAAKKKYYQTESLNFGSYDEKAMMQIVFYGLPMYEITSGGALNPEIPFPSVTTSVSPPTAFGSVAVGGVSLGLVGSFGAFDQHATGEGTFLAINDNISFDAGAPVQPRFYAPLSALPAGGLHGALFLGGVYTDVVHFDPVIARAHNEYVTSTSEPAFSAAGWYPSVPFQVRANSSISSTTGSLVSVLGQFNDATDTQRLYDHMAFATYFSNSADAQAPVVKHVDGVLGPGPNQGRMKVEAEDPSGVLRVVAAFTDGTGSWQSKDLAFSAATQKWTGVITATLQTRYFVQVVDGAGNVAVEDNKGNYFTFPPAVLLAPGRDPSLIYLPLLVKGG